MEYVKYLLQSIPIVVVLIIWAVRIENRLTKIETDLSWIKKAQNSCQPN